MTAIIDDRELNDFLSVLQSHNHRIVAPIQEDNHIRLRQIRHGAQWVKLYSNTQNSVKEYLFPICEELFQYTKDGEIRDVSREMPRTIFLGIRPCDAEAARHLDQVFNQDPVDEYYASKRRASIFIGYACNIPSSSCFCTSVNGGPHGHRGLDLIMTSLGNTYLIEAITREGHQLLEQVLPTPRPPSRSHIMKATQLKRIAESQIVRRIDTTDLTQRLLTSFNSRYWKQIAKLCIGCGICTFLCPTCHCFNIADEDMSRVKFWDSCQFPGYSKHANSHNPRNQIFQRLRNRILHKFLYFQQHFHEFLCVGCGRCIQNCPMQLDLVKMVSDVRSDGE